VTDDNGETLTISGANFGVSAGIFGTRPFVTLDLVPLDIRTATDTAILASAPSRVIPPGNYLLTVSRGPTPADNASLEVAIGNAKPSGAPATNSIQPEAKTSGTTTAGSKPSAQSMVPLSSASDVAAVVGDHQISVEDVDREWRRSNPAGYLQMIRQLYEARRQVLNAMVSDELLAREAADRGVSVESLLAQEVPKRVIPMPDSAVISLYLSLGDATRGATLDQMRPALRAWLERHSELEIAKMSYVEELKKVSTRADIVLDAPRVTIVPEKNDISLGPQTAPVDIVAFGDFQSPEYARFARSFSRVRDTFGERIRLTFRNLPTLGPESETAAEAALCANAQGKFWPFHDALVTQGPITLQRITDSAATAGVNRDTFNHCLERREFRDAIRAGLNEANGYGIQASPSFLVNGRLAPAPPPFLAPYDYFKLLIEEELGKLAGSRAR